MVPDDVVIEDIKDQALDIFFHGPQSTHRNGTRDRKDIHSHIHTPKTKSKTLKSPNMTPSYGCPLPVQCGGGRRPGSLADDPRDCSTSEAFSPRGTVMKENICRCVQNILQHFPITTPFLTVSTITYSWMASRTVSSRLGQF